MVDLAATGAKVEPVGLAMEITEQPHAPNGVAAFMSGHSVTPYITPSMNFSLGKGSMRAQGAAA